MDVQLQSFAKTLVGTQSKGGNRPTSQNSIPCYEVAVVICKEPPSVLLTYNQNSNVQAAP